MKIDTKLNEIDEIKNNVLKYNTTPVSNIKKNNNINTVVPHRKKPPNRMKMEESILLFKKNQNVNFIKSIDNNNDNKHNIRKFNTMEEILEANRKKNRKIIVIPIKS